MISTGVMNIAVEWKSCPESGMIKVKNGSLAHVTIARGNGVVNGNKFSKATSDSFRLEIALNEFKIGVGSDITLITVEAATSSFSFFLRDVNVEYPIFLPMFGVAVVPANDKRNYVEIEHNISQRNLKTKLEKIESEDEENYKSAAANTSDLKCPTWLGLSRDFRIFQVDYTRTSNQAWFRIIPRFHWERLQIPEAKSDQAVSYDFVVGRGLGCSTIVTRRLEDGCLPILHAQLNDEEIEYQLVCFVSTEKSSLSSMHGTHFLVAEASHPFHMFTDEQEQQYQKNKEIERNRDEETVLYFQISITNSGTVPKYAWIKTPRCFPRPINAPNNAPDNEAVTKFENGFSYFESGRVFCASKVNNNALQQEEMAILVKPGEKYEIEYYLPHSPVSKERAAKLIEQSFKVRYSECKEFWQKKLDKAAKIELPEKRIEEMIKAGLLHLDLISYGLEPNGTLAACVGEYTPIGSESAPIIQFMDSMGWHQTARRALTYFLDKQHDDGFMQNFMSYMLETGAALWSIGEHYRYTHDKDFIREIAPKLLKACEFLMTWRNANLDEKLRGRGYGMLDGKVADPEDPYHIFMLNGYAYVGLSRTAEMLAEIDPVASNKIRKQAEEFKANILSTLHQAIAESPVVPLGDGGWCPTVPPWAEIRGPACLYLENKKCYTHGTVMARDSLCGPLHLVMHEVLSPDDKVVKWLLDYHSELMCVENVAFAQPYYSPHPWIQLQLKQVKAFLKAYYNLFASLADRETYSFWECYYHISPHKTHEEAWFLMQTRWMLYMEKGQTLNLLGGIPRSWLKTGQKISIDNAATYFGALSFMIKAESDNLIQVEIKMKPERLPKKIVIRVPHHQGKTAVECHGGIYDSTSESVSIESFTGYSKLSIKF
jgi:hypothetical protein